jgi:hypothetical protein
MVAQAPMEIAVVLAAAAHQVVSISLTADRVYQGKVTGAEVLLRVKPQI